MIEFSEARQAILIDSVPIGAGVTVSEIVGKLPGSPVEVPGQEDYCSLDGEIEGLRYEVGFKGGVFESAILSVPLPWEGKWEELEQNESWRRTQHENLMLNLFNADRYNGPGILVQMVREPRNRTEEIRISTP